MSILGGKREKLDGCNKTTTTLKSRPTCFLDAPFKLLQTGYSLTSVTLSTKFKFSKEPLVSIVQSSQNLQSISLSVSRIMMILFKCSKIKITSVLHCLRALML